MVSVFNLDRYLAGWDSYSTSTSILKKKKEDFWGHSQELRKRSRNPVGIDETWLAAHLNALKQCLPNLKPFKWKYLL